MIGTDFADLGSEMGHAQPWVKLSPPAAHPDVAMSTPPAPPTQRHNPLHGLTLEAIVTVLVDFYGWDELAHLVPIRCFALNPSIKSSLTFLRKTPWAREKVESLYLFMLREQRRAGQAGD